MSLPNLDDLEASWLIFLEDRNERGKLTQAGAWRRDNPGEWEKLQAYRADGPRPELTSQFGRLMVEETDAWLVARGAQPVPPPSPQGVPIPTYRITQPQGAIAYWLYANSPTTQIIGTDGSGDRQRCIVWDTAGGQGEALYSGRDMYALTGIRYVDKTPARHNNFHTQPNDQPYSWQPLYKQGGIVSPAISSIAMDDWGSTPVESTYDGLQFKLECNSVSGNGTGAKFFPVLSRAELAARAGEWIWVWYFVRWGRTDSGPVTGALKIWVAGTDNTPRVDVSGINTHWWGQHQVTYWQGGYWGNGGPGYTVEMALTRFGRTPRECYEDVPVLHHGAGAGLTGGSSPGSHTEIESRLSDEAAIPADLVWGVQ